MSDDFDIRENALAFEAVQIAMVKDKNGYVLKLAIHPNEVPEDILRDLVGTRYQVALVKLGDASQPVKSEINERLNKVVTSAQMLCRDSRFWEWLNTKGFTDRFTEEGAVDVLRTFCGIKSRSELKTNPEARRKFLSLRDEFVNDLRRSIK